MDIIKKGFGDNLKILRKMRDFTQEKLAENVGINLRQLARIEAGESFVSSETLLKICTVLDVTPKDLFDYDINEAYLMTGTDDNVHFSVIKSGNIIQLVKDVNRDVSDFEAPEKQNNDLDERMSAMAKRLQRDITVDEIQDGNVIYTKIYSPIGDIKIKNNDKSNDEYNNLKNKINNISHDSRKLEFMNIAFDALNDSNALQQLKILIKGIELTQC